MKETQFNSMQTQKQHQLAFAASEMIILTKLKLFAQGKLYFFYSHSHDDKIFLFCLFARTRLLFLITQKGEVGKELNNACQQKLTTCRAQASYAMSFGDRVAC